MNKKKHLDELFRDNYDLYMTGQIGFVHHTAYSLYVLALFEECFKEMQDTESRDILSNFMLELLSTNKLIASTFLKKLRKKNPEVYKTLYGTIQENPSLRGLVE